MPKILRILIWLAVALLGALALATIALHRGEQINAMWLVVAAICTYAVGYRFYSKFIAAKVLTLDALRATPAERMEQVWELTLACLAWGSNDEAEPRLRRAVGRVLRPRR